MMKAETARVNQMGVRSDSFYGNQQFSTFPTASCQVSQELTPGLRTSQDKTAQSLPTRSGVEVGVTGVV